MTRAAFPAPPDADRFRWLALAAALTTYLLIVVGGIVRVTHSGLGCGRAWPLCNGQLFPALDGPVFITLSHRFLAALVYAVRGAYLAYQGLPFEYLWIGALARRAMEAPAASPA